jgi:hypothetical protein
MFANEEEEKAFVNALREHKIPLRDFALIYHVPLPGSMFSKKGLPLTNLTSVTWDITERSCCGSTSANIQSEKPN